MVIFRTFVISAFRICKDCSDLILGMCDHKECAKNETNAIFAVCHASDFADRRTVGASNLSTAIIILGIGAVLVFVASPKYAQFVWLCVSGAGFMGIFLALESYRLERLAIWRNPEKYEKGYQTLQGLFAIGSGGLFGRGLGASVQKLGFVPEAQNDMIFSIVCEELGLVGASFIILLFLILIWRFFMIATHAKDLFGALIASGAMAHMMIQVILNIAVVTNTIPNTGITLPFISYGGTSVMFLLLEMGLVLSVSNLIE